MKLKYIFAFIAVLASCSTLNTRISEVNTANVEQVIDSVKTSGTQVGDFSKSIFFLDDGKNDIIWVAPLFKKNKATGSIQVRETDSLFNVKIIDTLKK